jgi:hypothetical protein
MNVGAMIHRAGIACLVLLASCGHPAGSPNALPGNKTMQASTTYLYLLRNTPFFTRLSKPQLRWVIDHSREWEAKPGTTVTDCADASGDYWVLLDGGWQVDYDGKRFPAGHADAGKWFSAKEGRGTCQLVTTEHCYVMQIWQADMVTMLADGFAFDAHLDAGHSYYDSIFGGGQPGS